MFFCIPSFVVNFSKIFYVFCLSLLFLFFIPTFVAYYSTYIFLSARHHLCERVFSISSHALFSSERACFQGDQIGPIFASWTIVFRGQFFDNNRSSRKFCDNFYTEKVMHLF
jgi:hypothetical protein